MCRRTSFAGAFKTGQSAIERELLEDDARPGQAHRVSTPKMIAEVDALGLDNRRITMDEIHRLLGAPHNASTLELSKNLHASN
ncbi:hypothetical protein TNCV_4492441 [Trichonephila clavipes]|nr:hypothetical protein TNCV_4492441 [Trichonephila clavipes]